MLGSSIGMLQGGRMLSPLFWLVYWFAGEEREGLTAKKMFG